MSAISGQKLASLTIETLEKVRSDRDFDLFQELVLKTRQENETTKIIPCCSILVMTDNHQIVAMPTIHHQLTNTSK